ncbi:MAG: SHOCT domain-containing protein [Planctomycetota bacterium]|jgi:hypothetical protein
MSVDWPLSTAAATRPGDLFGQVWPWLAALLLVVGVGALVIYLIRRSMGRQDSGRDGFTLQDLRDLHASGALSAEEFAKAKASVIGRVTAENAQRDDAQRDDAQENGEADPGD